VCCVCAPQLLLRLSIPSCAARHCDVQPPSNALTYLPAPLPPPVLADKILSKMGEGACSSSLSPCPPASAHARTLLSTTLPCRASASSRRHVRPRAGVLGPQAQGLRRHQDCPQHRQVQARGHDRGANTVGGRCRALSELPPREPLTSRADLCPYAPTLRTQLEVLNTLERNDPDGNKWVQEQWGSDSHRYRRLHEPPKRELKGLTRTSCLTLHKRSLSCRNCVALREWFDYRGHVCMVGPHHQCCADPSYLGTSVQPSPESEMVHACVFGRLGEAGLFRCLFAVRRKMLPVRPAHCFNWYPLHAQVFEKLGPSLFDFMRKNEYRPFPIDLVQEFSRQLIQAVAYLHDLHLVHTDLKPENILLMSLNYCRSSSGSGWVDVLLPELSGLALLT